MHYVYWRLFIYRHDGKGLCPGGAGLVHLHARSGHEDGHEGKEKRTSMINARVNYLFISSPPPPPPPLFCRHMEPIVKMEIVLLLV